MESFPLIWYLLVIFQYTFVFLPFWATSPLIIHVFWCEFVGWIYWNSPILIEKRCVEGSSFVVEFFPAFLLANEDYISWFSRKPTGSVPLGKNSLTWVFWQSFWTLLRNPGSSCALFKLFPTRNRPSIVPKNVKKTLL